MTSAAAAGSDAVPSAAKPTALPALSASEFRLYNRMAEGMEYYHNHFRHTWNQLYAAVDPTTAAQNKPTSTLTTPALIRLGLGFVSQLTVHHNIEEQHIFPILGSRMPSFAPGSAPLEQHKEIHRGMDKLEAYLRECQRGERDLRREEVKKVMDGFGTVLWTHLDEEVRELSAEKMRGVWSEAEMKRLPM